MVRATYQVRVDRGDNQFTAPGENVTGDVLDRTPITTQRGLDQIEAITPPKAGSARFELDNRSGNYSPATLRHGSVRVIATYASTDYELFTGVLDRPTQNPDRFLPSVATSVLGTLSRLAGKTKLTTALYESITVDEALDVLLDAVGWPAADRVLDVGLTTLDWWWLDGEDCLQAAKALLNTEGPGAVIYEDGLGNFVFKNRHARLTESRSSTAQADYGGVGNLPIHDPVEYHDASENVINFATVTVRVRTAQSVAAVWSYGQTLSLAADEVRTIGARSTTGNPFKSAVAPVLTTDYAVSSGSVASVTLDRTSGPTVMITITAGASGATITGLQLRAALVTVTSEIELSTSLDTSASIAEHGLQTYNLELRPEISALEAQSFVDAIAAWYQDGRATISFRSIANTSAAAMTSALEREISDRIAATVYDISGDFWVNHLTHSIGLTGVLHEVEFSGEAVPTIDMAQWDIGRWDISFWGW